MRERKAQGIHFSRSASGRTTKGSEPPSSNTTFLIARPAVAATALPALSLPVRETPRIWGDSINWATFSLLQKTDWKTPFGNPTSWKRREIVVAHPGTFGACFRIMVFPAISAGIEQRKTCQNGKFHGMMIRITPSGSNRT